MSEPGTHDGLPGSNGSTVLGEQRLEAVPGLDRADDLKPSVGSG